MEGDAIDVAGAASLVDSYEYEEKVPIQQLQQCLFKWALA